MRSSRLVPCFALLACLGTPLHASVVVSAAVDPDRFADGGDRNTDPRKVMQALENHLKRLGDRFLAPGENLQIEIRDLDRAGRPRGNLPSEIRIMTGKGDMPCIDLRYTLESGGAAARSASEKVCDPEYLRPLEFKYDEHDPLVYEKRMLDQWFERRFGKGVPWR